MRSQKLVSCLQSDIAFRFGPLLQRKSVNPALDRTHEDKLATNSQPNARTRLQNATTNEHNALQHGPQSLQPPKHGKTAAHPAPAPAAQGAQAAADGATRADARAAAAAESGEREAAAPAAGARAAHAAAAPGAAETEGDAEQTALRRRRPDHAAAAARAHVPARAHPVAATSTTGDEAHDVAAAGDASAAALPHARNDRCRIRKCKFGGFADGGERGSGGGHETATSDTDHAVRQLAAAQQDVGSAADGPATATTAEDTDCAPAGTSVTSTAARLSQQPRGFQPCYRRGCYYDSLVAAI
ncbi:unnamed protein product [Phytophthora lilii]|uniref:Unnamed protein product n=1 Tax=Phytophthora lilii TaxID=2077276 RepID=A0A9W6TE81_9STRA|nr:unnamed protein product [Phytophthora lilii]